MNGVAFSGMGLGIFLAAPLTALLVDRVGWRWAMASLGAGAGLLLLPAVLLTPRLMAERSASPAPSAAHSDDGPGLSAALATPRFWCFAAAFFFTPVSNFMVTTHQVAHIVEAGIDARRAAAAFGAVGLLSALGRVTFGTLSDRWGRVPTALLSYVATAGGTLALLLLAPGSPGWLLWAYVLPFGLTFGARGPIVAALTADVYRGRSFGSVLGVITFGNRVGSAIGPWLGGVIYDLTGSYRLRLRDVDRGPAVAAVAFAAAGRAGRATEPAGRIPDALGEAAGPETVLRLRRAVRSAASEPGPQLALGFLQAVAELLEQRAARPRPRISV